MTAYYSGLGQGTANLGNAAARISGNAYQSFKFGARLATMDPVAQAQLISAFRDIYSFAQLASSDPCFRQALTNHLKQQITDPDVLAKLAANTTVDAALSVLTLGLGKAAQAGKMGQYLENLASVAKKSGAARNIPSVDAMSRAASAPVRGDLTQAGRALQKHGGRQGSAFPAATGNPSQISRAGQNVVDDILTSPGATTTTRHHARYGNVTEVRAPDGRGVRYDSQGNFMGFLEPGP